MPVSRHGSVLGAEELGRVEPDRFGMVGIHMRDRARFGVDQILRAGNVGHDVGGFQIGGAGEAAIEMGGHDVSRQNEKSAKPA